MVKVGRSVMLKRSYIMYERTTYNYGTSLSCSWNGGLWVVTKSKIIRYWKCSQDE